MFLEARWYALLASSNLSSLSETSLERLPNLPRPGVRSNYGEGGVGRLEACGEMLGTEHAQVVFDFQHLGFRMEIVNSGHLEAARGDTQSAILQDLEPLPG